MSVNSISHNDIIISKAASSYGRIPSHGNEVSAGKKTTRLNLSIKTDLCETAKTSSNVYVETIGNRMIDRLKYMILCRMDKKFAKIKVKDSQADYVIFVNVNSLSKRLGIAKQDIFDAIKEDKLELLIKGAHEKNLKYEGAVLKKYNQMIKTYDVKNDQLHLTTETSSINTHISTNTLYKIIGLSLTSSLGDGQHLIQVKGKKVLLSKQNETLNYYHFSSYLGSGGFGVVSRVTDIANGIFVAAKETRLYGRSDYKNEFKILRKIHSKGVIKGIQRAPFEIFDLKDSKFSGYIAPLYDSDLSNAPLHNMSMEDKFDCAHQLLRGLKYCLDDMDLVLGDIKPQNCLVKEEQGKYECVLSDFGGAQELNDPRNILSWGDSTPGYYSKKDYQSYLKLQKQLTKNILPKNESDKILAEMKELKKARDVYALGLVLKYLLNNLPKDKSQQVKNLISEMTNPNYKERISISQALSNVKNIMQ